MAVEQFANLAETTLASGYTSGGSSISVASASGFPTSGVFRVRLGNAGKTIYRVDSVSGTTFTGGAEFNDANANAGETVKIVASRQVAERWIQTPTGSEVFGAAGVSGADRWGPIHKVVYPVSASFAWGNQGGAAIDTTFGFTRLTCPSTGTNVRRRGMSAPGTPYQVDAVIQYKDSGSSSRYGGLFFRESSTGKLHLFQCLSTNNQFQVVNFTNDSTFSSNPANATLEGSILGSLAPFWIRIRDNGTNLFFTASRDGLYYLTELSVGRTSFMAGGPDEIGFFGNVDGSAGQFEEDIFDWLVS
ncbi:MAG TPA: hypothetical protein VKN16_21375 [Methylomirabilota bacterium]|jgi:hypothetical protein|nr:hypothetical protein [Methylomirabilota bacterium]